MPQHQKNLFFTKKNNKFAYPKTQQPLFLLKKIKPHPKIKQKNNDEPNPKNMATTQRTNHRKI